MHHRISTRSGQSLRAFFRFCRRVAAGLPALFGISTLQDHDQPWVGWSEMTRRINEAKAKRQHMPMLDNPKWERFAQASAAGMNATDAMAEAGYARIGANAKRLTNNDQIKDRVKEIQGRDAADLKITRQWLIEQQVDVYKEARQEKDYGPANTALKQAAIMSGHWVEKSESDVNLATFSDEPMSPEEWKAEFVESH